MGTEDCKPGEREKKDRADEEMIQAPVPNLHAPDIQAGPVRDTDIWRGPAVMGISGAAA